MAVNNINLNKIDPVIVNHVQQQTVEGVVHASEKTRIDKDKKEKKQQFSYKSIKDKLARLNSRLSSAGIDAVFEMQDDGSVVAYDKDRNIIKKFSKDELNNLLDNMEDMAGVFVDLKK
ncbi:hypothetical protein OXPF_17630 [Oxobacter pfennigii]|uniref:Flagellar protein FlaG n=1 Tax=Oxobacter pfennigii TaxID=36849 RepID=A0A0P9AGV6_9CLOT|nr:flagellar protein FlaG [Oxobacter pfennigii]KPU44677.1 hypothetical protein OXPF_17630 [Oxobacter pfennigii]